MSTDQARAFLLAALVALGHERHALAFEADCRLWQRGSVEDRAGARWCHVAGDAGRFREWPEVAR